jgi:ribosomal protein S18 acetylase RimI-like enzyme
LVVRIAGQSEVEALAAIRHERDGGSLEEARSHFSVLLAGERTARLLLVGSVDGEPAGYGELGRFDPPGDAPSNHAPAGWYLQGLVVGPQWRRLGLGAELTRRRLEWLAARAEAAYYFANSRNLATIALHARFGFEELSRDFWYPGVTFTGGEGVLFRAEVRNAAR